MLVNKRLDLDIAITRVRKAHEADREARVSHNVLTLLHTFIIGESKNVFKSYSTCNICFFLSLCQNLNANPMEEDYLSHVSYMFSFLRVKWLKVSDAAET